MNRIASGHEGDVLAPLDDEFDADRALPLHETLGLERSVFPADVFPSAFQDFCGQAAQMVQAPIDFVAVALLSFCAGVIGSTCKLELKPGSEVRPILWTCIVAPPGSAKTPAIESVRSLVTSLQDEAQQEFDTRFHEWRAGNSKEGKGRGESNLGKKPVLEHFFTTDATKEAIVAMAESSVGFTLYRDEILAWIASFDAYRAGKGGDRQDALSLWSGVGMKVDRKGSETVVASAPTVSVCGGTQPDKLKVLRGDISEDDGFFDRFLWSYIESPPSLWSDDGLDPEVRDRALSLMRMLRKIEEPTTTLRMDTMARGAWKDWYNNNQYQVAASSAGAKGIYAKLPVQLARIALVLQIMHDPDRVETELGLDRLQDAIRVVEYFRFQAHRVLARIGSVTQSRSDLISDRLLALFQIDGDWKTTSDLYRHFSNNISASDLHGALASLERSGRISSRHSSSETKSAKVWRAAS